MIRLLTLLLALLSVLPTSAGASYTSLFVFGDSLSDNGNAFALSGGIWPPSPPYAQRFSNGPVAAERLAADLGLPLAPSTAGGTNYAVGGATTGTANYNFEVQSPFPLPSSLANTGVLNQVGSFAATQPAIDPAHSLFMLWAGPNDFFLALDTGASIPNAIAAAVGNLATAVGTLAGLGAQHIFLPNMPNLAETPFGVTQSPTDRALLDALSTAFNTALAAELAQLDKLPGLDLMTFDTAALLDDVVANPGAFGFSNASTPCLAAPADAASGCQGYLFFDEVHLTTAGYAILGDRFFAAVVPEPPGLFLALLAVIMVLPASCRRRAAGAVSGAFQAVRSTA